MRRTPRPHLLSAVTAILAAPLLIAGSALSAAAAPEESDFESTFIYPDERNDVEEFDSKKTTKSERDAVDIKKVVYYLDQDGEVLRAAYSVVDFNPKVGDQSVAIEFLNDDPDDPETPFVPYLDADLDKGKVRFSDSNGDVSRCRQGDLTIKKKVVLLTAPFKCFNDDVDTAFLRGGFFSLLDDDRFIFDTHTEINYALTFRN